MQEIWHLCFPRDEPSYRGMPELSEAIRLIDKRPVIIPMVLFDSVFRVETFDKVSVTVAYNIACSSRGVHIPWDLEPVVSVLKDIVLKATSRLQSLSSIYCIDHNCDVKYRKSVYVAARKVDCFRLEGFQTHKHLNGTYYLDNKSPLLNDEITWRKDL